MADLEERKMDLVDNASGQNDNDNDNDETLLKLILPQSLENYIKTNKMMNLSEDCKLVNPDIHKLFNKYNQIYFNNEIICELKWTDTDKTISDIQNQNKNHKNGHKKKARPKKKRYAASCTEENQSGFCCIRMDKAVVQYKSTRYLIETLIHHMIHSYLFQIRKTLKIVKNSKESWHSKHFAFIMNSINTISVPYIKLNLNNKQCKKNDDSPSEIIPNELYLGNIHHALNWDVLKALKITHIVNCTNSIDNKFENDITYCRVPVNDKATESIMHHFVKAIRFIEKVRNEGMAKDKEKQNNDNNNGQQNDNTNKSENKILIHCHAGISRSATITIAYLMYSWHMTMFEAITHVQSKRYIIAPNQGFKNQLLDFYLYLEENEGNLEDFEKLYKLKTPSPKRHVQQPSKEALSNFVAIAAIDGGNGNGNGNDANNVQGIDDPKQFKNYVPCPVCQKFFTKKQINQHLDKCLS